MCDVVKWGLNIIWISNIQLVQIILVIGKIHHTLLEKGTRNSFSRWNNSAGLKYENTKIFLTFSMGYYIEIVHETSDLSCTYLWMVTFYKSIAGWILFWRSYIWNINNLNNRILEFSNINFTKSYNILSFESIQLC